VCLQFPTHLPTLLFSQSEAEYGDDVMGRSLGTLGQSGSGKLRLVKKEKKQVATKRLKAVHVGSSGATGGFASSLAFTPVQVGPDECGWDWGWDGVGLGLGLGVGWVHFVGLAASAPSMYLLCGLRRLLCTCFQGFELAKAAGVGKKASEKYFSSTGTFTQIRPGT
jgi:hypothetical protein